MAQPHSKAQFWAILSLTNLLVIIYPASMYLNADADGTQVLAAIVMVSIALVLAIADAVCIAVTYAS